MASPFKPMLSRFAPLLLVSSVLVAGPESTMRMVFEDQFNGDKIDASKWNFNPAVVTLGTSPDGTNKATVVNLNIVSRGKPTLWSGSGMDCKFRQPYGYYEARMRMVQTGGHGCGMGFDIGAPAGKRFPSMSTGFGSGGVPGQNVAMHFRHSLPEGGVLKSFPDPTQGPEPFQIDWVKIYKQP